MPLDYLKLQNQIQNMANAAQNRQHELSDRLGQCQQVFQQQAENLIGLQGKVERIAASEKTLRCAVPVSEPLNAHFAAPETPAGCTVLSADGSQITPNAHEAIFYGVVNVGVFCMQPGSGLAPLTSTHTDLIFEESNPDENELITEELINLKRDVTERQILAGYAGHLPAPVITLTDGPLELYHEPRENKLYREYFNDYLDALSDLALTGAVTAGYIDRPRASLLVNLLEIAVRPENDTNASARQFTGLSDLALMRPLLAPGERSAIFKMQSSSSKEYKGNKELHFFYLNVGSPEHPAIGRVELPLWVAKSPESVNLLHAVLLDQAHLSGAHPYPYALVRAHETAVVKMDEGEALKNLIQKEFLRRGIPLSIDSEKLANKKVGARTRYNR